MNPELPETSLNGTTGIPEFPVIPTEYGKTGNGPPWRAMLCHLRGKRPPALPRVRGRRVHQLRDEPLTPDQWLHVTSVELARELGISRQAAWQRQNRLRQQQARKEPR